MFLKIANYIIHFFQHDVYCNRCTPFSESVCFKKKKKKCLSFLSFPPRLLYQQQSMWMAMFWLSQTTCLYTTTPNMEGGLAALTPQKVRPLLIWKMVGTHLHGFLICNAFFAPFFSAHNHIYLFFMVSLSFGFIPLKCISFSDSTLKRRLFLPYLLLT